MATLNFNAQQHTPSQSFDLLPLGWYNMVIDESEIAPTKNGDGTRLKIRFNILDGFAAGQKAFMGLNIENPNPKAVEISYSQLSAICAAIGLNGISDSQELHGKPLKVKLKVVKDSTGEYEDKNEPCGWKEINAAVTMALPPTAPAQQAPGGFAQQPQQGFAQQPQQAQQAQQGFQPTAQQAGTAPAQQQAVADNNQAGFQQPVQQQAQTQQPTHQNFQDPQNMPQQNWQQPVQGQGQAQGQAAQTQPQQEQTQQPQAGSTPAWAQNQG